MSGKERLSRVLQVCHLPNSAITENKTAVCSTRYTATKRPQSERISGKCMLSDSSPLLKLHAGGEVNQIKIQRWRKDRARLSASKGRKARARLRV